jgi:hypothetical protein
MNPFQISHAESVVKTVVVVVLCVVLAAMSWRSHSLSAELDAERARVSDLGRRVVMSETKHAECLQDDDLQ